MAPWASKPYVFGPAGGFGGAIDAQPQHPSGFDSGLVVAGVALLHSGNLVAT